MNIQNENEPLFSEEEYLGLLELTYSLAEAISGKVFSDGRKPDSQLLALKLFTLAASAYQLYKGTRLPFPASTGGSDFIDFSSIAILTRSAIETYLTFFDVFVAPKNNDEFEFRYCLWYLSGYVSLEKFDPHDPDLQADYGKAQEEIFALRERIKATSIYKSLKEGDQNDILKGKRQRNWDKELDSAGFGKWTFRNVYRYNSGFVHADGLTTSQLMSAETKEDQLFHAETDLVTMMVIISKFIVDFGLLYEEASLVFPRFDKIYKRALMWSDIARKLD